MAHQLAVLAAIAMAMGHQTFLPPPIVVHRYAAVSQSFHENAYWLESADGLVLIDALLLKSDARLLAATMKATGKPLKGIFLTHPHLDHFGGIRTIVSAFPGTPVYATQATAEGVMPMHEQASKAPWVKALGDNYDAAPYVPETIVAPGATLTLAGMRFTFHDVGAMEASNNTVIVCEDLKAAFTGDATVSNAPFYVGEGRSQKAIDVLASLPAKLPGVGLAYSGHYEPAPLAAVVDANISAVRFYRDVVAMALATPAWRQGNRLSQAGREAAARLIADRFAGQPAYGLGQLAIAQMNVAALEAELRAAKVSTDASPLQAGVQRLHFMLGRWPAASFWLGDGATRLEGIAKVRDNLFQYVLAYDAVQRRYRFSSIDSRSGLLDSYTGDFDDSGALVMTNVESGTHYLANGTPVHNRLVMIPGAGGAWSWRVDSSNDRGVTWQLAKPFEFPASGRLQ